MLSICHQNLFTYIDTKIKDQENACEITLSNDLQMNWKKNTFLPHKTSLFIKKNQEIQIFLYQISY